MPTHKGTVTLETPRLILRRFTLEDAPAMYRNWACDPEVTRYLTWPTHDHVDTSRRVIESWVSEYSRDSYYHWAIVLKTLDQPIGSLIAISGDDRIAMAHIGYCIGRPWWHQGIMTEALTAVMDYLFDQVGMNRVESCHDVNNPHSGAVMRKCGMQYEGTFRQAKWTNQGLSTTAHYAALRQDRQ